MIASKLIRWSGLLVIMQSALFLLWWVLLGTLLPINVPLVDLVLDGNWVFVNMLGLIAAVLVPLCLVGLYARQVEKVGILGFVNRQRKWATSGTKVNGHLGLAPASPGK